MRDNLLEATDENRALDILAVFLSAWLPEGSKGNQKENEIKENKIREMFINTVNKHNNEKENSSRSRTLSFGIFFMFKINQTTPLPKPEGMTYSTLMNFFFSIDRHGLGSFDSSLKEKITIGLVELWQNEVTQAASDASDEGEGTSNNVNPVLNPTEANFIADFSQSGIDLQKHAKLLYNKINTLRTQKATLENQENKSHHGPEL